MSDQIITGGPVRLEHHENLQFGYMMIVQLGIENVAISVRIAGDAIDVLSKLAKKLGQSKAQVIEMALKQMEERIFWGEVHQSFERIAADPNESAYQGAEVELWNQGTARDFKEEEW